MLTYTKPQIDLSELYRIVAPGTEATNIVMPGKLEDNKLQIVEQKLGQWRRIYEANGSKLLLSTRLGHKWSHLDHLMLFGFSRIF